MMAAEVTLPLFNNGLPVWGWERQNLSSKLRVLNLPSKSVLILSASDVNLRLFQIRQIWAQPTAQMVGLIKRTRSGEESERTDCCCLLQGHDVCEVAFLSKNCEWISQVHLANPSRMRVVHLANANAAGVTEE